MILKYGTYSHALNEAEVVIEREPGSGGGGNVALLKERWTISGELQAASQSAITTAINALQAAYSENGQDLILAFDDGSASAHQLLSSGPAGGVQVKRMSFPIGRGSEYGTHRTYQIVCEADIPLEPEEGAGAGSGSGGANGDGAGSEPGQGSWVTQWTEILTFTGGGPRFTFLPVINGLPQRQMTNQSTTYKATQMGQGVGMFWWPNPPPRLWPVFEHEDQRQISRASPKLTPTGEVEYGISWQYVFESATPLTGNPHLPLS